MEIIFKTYHGIDITNDRINRRSIENNFDEIIKSMIVKINENASSKAYKPIANNTQVVNTIDNIINVHINDENENKIVEYLLQSDSIADRLRIKEIAMESRMSHLSGIQKGSLLQALIKDSNLEFRYFIAKIENRNFVSDDDLILRAGFNPDENKIWKTCIFKCSIDEEDNVLNIDEANIYMNNPAVYWSSEFLEVEELRTDEKNTREAWKGIEGYIKKKLKASAPSDYFVLRNYVIKYFRTEQTIDYNNMIDSIFNGYVPIDTDLATIEEAKSELKKLPTKNNFDSNFNSVPKQVKAKLKSTHKVNNRIDIIIKEGLDGNSLEYRELIHTKEDAGGNRFVVIKVTDDETYNMLNLDREQ